MRSLRDRFWDAEGIYRAYLNCISCYIRPAAFIFYYAEGRIGGFEGGKPGGDDPEEHVNLVFNSDYSGVLEE